MKKYVAPVAEKVEFNYNEQIVASGEACASFWTMSPGGPCTIRRFQPPTLL